MTSELRANTAPFTQFEQNIVINIPRLKKIIWVIGVLRRTVVIDWRFDNLCGSHLQSQVVVLVSWKFNSWVQLLGSNHFLIVINRFEVRKESHRVLFARTVSGIELTFFVLPWSILVLPWTIWFCHELYGFAVNFFGFAVSFFILPWAILFSVPWTICNCGDSYLYKQLGHKQFS